MKFFLSIRPVDFDPGKGENETYEPPTLKNAEVRLIVSDQKTKKDLIVLQSELTGLVLGNLASGHGETVVFQFEGQMITPSGDFLQ
jgi:hypothetical protein